MMRFSAEFISLLSGLAVVASPVPETGVSNYEKRAVYAGVHLHLLVILVFLPRIKLSTMTWFTISNVSIVMDFF
jgi:hypothetical protein